MKIICSKISLLKSLNISMRAVPSRTTMDILECVLIDASASRIFFSTNDMDLGIQTLVEGDIVEKGIAAIDAKIFYEIVRRLPDNDITIHTGENYTATITCEKSKFTIPWKPGDDFPYIPIVDKEETISLSQFTLKEMIRQTIFSIGMNENNPIMTGELFELRQNILRMASLDGHRISIRNLPLEGTYQDRKAIIPGKTLNEISKILSGEMDDQVKISLSDKHVLFELEDTIVVSRLIEGEYFRIDHMISHDYETKLVVNRKKFMECLDRCSLLIREDDKKPVVIKTESDRIDLRVDSSMGSMREEIVVDMEGKDIIIGFNPRFIMDALRAVSDEEISIYLVNAKAPCFIRDDEGNYVYLILPVNINPANYA